MANDLPNNVTPLKDLYIVGHNINIAAEMSALYEAPGRLIIKATNDQAVTPEYIAQVIKEKGYKATKDTRIDILAHGIRIDNQHYIQIGRNPTLYQDIVSTKNFLTELQAKFDCPLKIFLDSCYGGSAKKLISVLKPGSILVTAIDSKLLTLHSISYFQNKAIREGDLADPQMPELERCIKHLIHSAQPFSFSFKDSDGEIFIIKSERILGKGLLVFKQINDELNNPWEIQQVVEYIVNKNVNNTLNSEPCKKLLEKHSQYRIAQDFQITVTPQGAQDYLAGLALHIITSYFIRSQKKYKLETDDYFKFLDNIEQYDVDLLTDQSKHPLLLEVVGHLGNCTKLPKQLIDKGAKVNAQDENGSTALIFASQNGHLATVELLLKYRAKVDTQDKKGTTALTLASQNGHLATVEILLKYGANVNTQNKEGTTPLMLALQNRRTETVKLLLAHGAKVDTKNEEGTTALIIAARNGYKENVDLLLKAEANINAQDKNGFTALMLSACMGHEKTAFKLLSRPAIDIELECHNGSNILGFVAQGGCLDLVIGLLNRGLDPDKLNKDDEAAIYYAAKGGHTPVIKFLYSKMKDPNVKVKALHASLKLAKENNHPETIKCLESLIETMEQENARNDENEDHTAQCGQDEIVAVLPLNLYESYIDVEGLLGKISDEICNIELS